MDTLASLLDSAFWLTVAAILALLLLSAFFSGSETALTASSRGKLSAQADKGSRAAAVALKLTEDGERLIGAILLGNNLVNILAASLATALFTRLFGESGVALATLMMTLLVLIFSEVLPKTYAITNPETAAARVARPIRLVVIVFAPVVAAVRILVRGILRLFGVRADPDSQVLSVREEIAGAITLGHHEGAVEREDRDRILGALDLGDRTVEEIMRHRSAIEMIDADAPPDAIIEKVVNSAHTRLPVFQGEPENIVGVVHVRDLLLEMNRRMRAEGQDTAELQVLDIARPPYFVPETTPLDEQMRQFLTQRRHFALVVDEYGALHGLITLEDIIEEIVGEIEDEFDIRAKQAIEWLDNGDLLVDGAMTIRDLNRETDWSLPDDEANTVAGLVIHEAQTIPAVGQIFEFHGCRFEICGREENRVTRIHIRRCENVA